MAKGLTFLKAARSIVLAINVGFFILGVILLGIALAGYVRSEDVKQQTDIMASLNLDTLTFIIIAAGGATILSSFVGMVSAYYKHMWGLKFYVVLTLITFITQIAIGAYLLNIDMSGLRTSWEQDDETGYERRVDLQDYMTCCGFDRWSDSIGTLHTDCPYMPTWPDLIEPQTCKEAAQDFVNSWLGPIAIASIVVGCIEAVAVSITFTLIFKSKDKNSDTAFDY